MSDAIVVGAGPAGSATAWALARAGARVVLIDRARFPRDKPCAEYLSPQASRILHEMGALASVEAAGAARLGGMEVYAPGGDTIRGDFAGAHGFRGFRDHGLAIRRTRLDAILVDRARAAGATVIENFRVTDVVRDRRGRVHGVHGINGRDRTLRAATVIGADGLRSVVARRLDLARHRPWPQRLALVAHYRGVSGMTVRGEMHVFGDGYVGLADVGGGVTNVAAVVPRRTARRFGADPSRFLGEWLRARPTLARRFASAERLAPVRVTGPFASHARSAWHPGALLVGDAADFFDPFTGEGIYAALRGGELAAQHTLRALDEVTHEGVDDALRAYESDRRREFGSKWMVERLIGAAVAMPPLLDRAARVLARRKDMADLFVGVTGDFVPPREVLRPRFLLRLLGIDASSPPP